MPIACVALGSNLGDRQLMLDRAAGALSRLDGVRVVARSRDYETEPVGGSPGQPLFLNAAMVLDTQLSPHELLDRMQAIEAELGRPPAGERVPCDPRAIDLDLLLYDNQVICDERLVVPHPRMHLRRFVLEPLCEIAPQVRHPLLGVTILEMLSWLK